MSKRRCGGCGKDPAEGFASINDTFYCHGDGPDANEVTCFMVAQAPVYTDPDCDWCHAKPLPEFPNADMECPLHQKPQRSWTLEQLAERWGLTT